MVQPQQDPSTDFPDDLAAQWIGRELDGRYRIVELLAEGGMGAVFVAEHLTLPKQVAIKMIRADFAAHSQAEARFTREALATASIDHPHVVSAIDYGRLPGGGGMYLVIQLVRGESVTQRLDHGPMPWQQVCILGSQIADALAAAHEAGIVHRDLKPDNILLEKRSDNSIHAKVVDFGIARVTGDPGGMTLEAGQPLTSMGAVIGTPGYMAPEQIVGEQIDFRVDLYALGVILWECCTGKILWQSETLTELRAFQLSTPALSLKEAMPGKIPQALAALVDRLLARSAANRPASAAAVRDELRRLAMRGELGGAVAPTMIGSVSAASFKIPADAQPTDAKPAEPRPAQPRPAPAMTAANSTSSGAGGVSGTGLWLGLAGLLAVLVLIGLLGRCAQQ